CHDHDHEHHHHHDDECHHEHEHEHHHHHEHDEHCTCGCHDHDHEHHHHHDDECHHEHEHHHHHEHDEHCTCGCHDHDHEHHHHHHADEVFASWGMETAKKFTAEGIEKILASLDDEERFGVILRAKGIVAAEDGQWLHFDHVPGENNIRRGSAGITGRFCVIGSHINEHELAELFGI
ncbi:MAG: GTP-binding protein, partial [Oscillospiraceae bacterium]|nr:GTP-binding protein [Oscillospiraceae bacterium]